MSPDRVCTIIAACCILHNIAINHHEPIDREEEEILLEEDNQYDGVNTGAAIRNSIAAT